MEALKNIKEVEIIEPKNELIKKLLTRGIPVKAAHFQASVNNAQDVPENYFSSKSQVASRIVKMWWINGDGLLCYHMGEWFMVPTANVRFHKFDDK